MSEEAEIVIEPYKKIVVHEIVEFPLNEWVEMILSGTRAAGGTTIPMVNWCDGVAFQISPFNPNSDEVISEQLKGIIHYAAVTFAIKERYEREIRISEGTIRLVDRSANPNLLKLARVLKTRAQHQA
jgi:hypothetical protein